MGWSNALATGSETLEFRLWIEGIDYGFVTSRTYGPITLTDRTLTRSPVVSTTNFEGWYVGLQREGISFSQSVDIPNAKLSTGGMTLRIADVDGKATEAFALEPDGNCYLTADVDDNDTTLNTTSTSLIDDESLIFLNGETMYVSAKTANTLTVSRGWRGSTAQYHYTEDGEKLRTPEITNRPRFFEGRRCRIYAYSPGDATGGTAIFYGMLSGEPRMSDPGNWELTIDSVSKVLDQDMGAELQSELPIRGAYYPYNAPFVMRLWLFDGDTIYGLSAPTDVVTCKVVGFFESNEDFCKELNSQIQLVIGAWGTTVTVQESSNGISVTAKTDASSYMVAVYIKSYHTIAGVFQDGWTIEASGDTVGASGFSANTLYKWSCEMPWPRSWSGEADFELASEYTSTDSADIYPSNRIYVGGDYLPTDLSKSIAVTIAGTERLLPITNIDTSSRYVEFSPSMYRPVGFQVDSESGLKLYVNYLVLSPTTTGTSSGTVADFVAALKDLGPRYSNLGYCPMFTNGDLDESATYTHVGRATSGKQYLRNRTYVSASAFRVADMLAEECKLIGCYPAINSSGQVYIRQLQVPGANDFPVMHLDPSNTIMGTVPTIERNAYGTFNAMAIKLGYNYSKDSYEGSTIVIRDQLAMNRSRVMRTISCSPKSGNGQIELASEIGEFVEGELSVLQPIWATFARPYSIIKIRVPLTAFGVYIGDIVTIENSILPDYKLGVRGWTTARRGLVVGREWDMAQGQGTLTLISSGMPYAGYTPTMYISSYTGGSPVSTTTLTVSASLPAPYDGSPSLLPSGSDATDFFETGMSVKIYQLDSSSSSYEQATVTGVTATTIAITIDTGTWTPGSSKWLVGYDVGDEDVSDSQLAFCYVADADRQVATVSTTLGTFPARVFA